MNKSPRMIKTLMAWLAANTIRAITNLGVCWLAIETLFGRLEDRVIVYALDWGKALRLLLEGAAGADEADGVLFAAVT